MIDFNLLTQSFDLPVMSHLQGTTSLFMDRFILILTAPLTWVPLYLTLAHMVVHNNRTMKHVFLIILFSLLAIGIADISADYIFKPYFMRLRPTYDTLLKYTIDTIDNGHYGLYSFPSSHACNTVACAVFYSLLVKNRLFTCVIVAWALLIGYTRIYLGAHFPSDVIAGIAWGCLVGMATYYVYYLVSRRILTQPIYISKKYTATGYSYDDIYIIAIVTILLLLFALFRSIFSL